MPTYDYRCDKCGKNFDKMIPIAQRDQVACPSCGHQPVKRLITGGSFMKGGSTPCGSTPSSCGSGGFS